MHKTTIYLAGPIKGNPENYKLLFEEAEFRLQHEDRVILNPAKLLEGMEDRDCLPICLQLIEQADNVILLPGWRDSLGAVTEAHYAIRQGKFVIAYRSTGWAYSVGWDGHKLTGGEDAEA